MKKPKRLSRSSYLRIGLIVLGLTCVSAFFVLLLNGNFNRKVINGTLISSDTAREYLLYVPESYSRSTAAPLVVSLHGYSSWPNSQMVTDEWTLLADREGFIVVYPSGTGTPKRWRIPENNIGLDRSDEDVIFISDLIDRLQRRYSIDPQRIYVNGLSNGASMSVAAGCELADRVAAIGGVAGAYYIPLESCHPNRPVPMIAFHGTDDPVVPYHGGPSGAFDLAFPDVPEWMEARAALNGCGASPVTIFEAETVIGIEYPDCEENASVIFYTIEGGGHTWPGGYPIPEAIAGYTSDAISATDLMWDFFKQHPLPVE